MGKFKLIPFLALLNVASFAQSGTDAQFSFFAVLSKDTILIGDQILLKVTARVPENSRVGFPIFTSDTLVKGIEIVRKPFIDSVRVKGIGKEYVMNLLITSFDSGAHYIPPVPVAYINQSKVDTAYTNTLELNVKTLPRNQSGNAGIYDIKPPIAEPLTIAEVAPWAGGGLMLAALIVLLIVYLKRRKQNRPFYLIQKPTDPPHVVALRELEKIRAEKLWASENHKLFYTRLIDVVRYYIEGRFRVPAMEQTTDEILGSLKKVDYPFDELYDQLQEALTLADLVKFAKFTPMISENERNMNFAFEFVEKTKQEIAPDDNGKGDKADAEVVNSAIEAQANEPKMLN